MNGETRTSDSEQEQEDAVSTRSSASSITSSSSSSSRSSSQSQHCRSSRLQVCRGPDCSRGGGSAVLELEELCEEYHHKKQQGNNSILTTEEDSLHPLLLCLPIQHVGCRNFCAVGPNVYYGKHQDQHFQRVSSPQACADLVQQVIELHYEKDNNNEQPSSTASSSSTTLSRMLFKAADRVRWEWMRQAQHHHLPSTSSGNGRANTNATSTATNNKNPTAARARLKEELEAVHAAELRAAQSLRTGVIQDEHVERAKRRYQRLSQLLVHSSERSS